MLLWYPNFKKEHRSWDRNGILTYDLQCAFLGKTGYGKSTTINSLIGKNVFKTSDTSPATKSIQSAEWLINKEKNIYFSIADLPGIGESAKNDIKYGKLYDAILEKSDLIVYLLRADMRDYKIDVPIIEKLINSKKKFVIGMNCIDKIEPINRSVPFRISRVQQKNFTEKRKILLKRFEILERNIIPYSAQEKFGMNNLINVMINNLIRSE